MSSAYSPAALPSCVCGPKFTVLYPQQTVYLYVCYIPPAAAACLYVGWGGAVAAVKEKRISGVERSNTSSSRVCANGKDKRRETSRHHPLT